MNSTGADAPNVGLFVTCIVDLFRPVVGFATVDLLRKAGCTVTVPSAQTCCGQPAYNSGDTSSARAIAIGVLEAFRSFDFVVAPSGSCTCMLKFEYPKLFADDPALKVEAQDLAHRTHELVSFLTDVMHVDTTSAAFRGPITYHDGCSALRELGIQEQPRRLLRALSEAEFRELPNSDACCGFGGTFCVKYPYISMEMVSRKAAEVRNTNAELLCSTDMGCLMNIAGRLAREGSDIEVRHVAEVLAGMLDDPAIGRGSR